MCMRVELNQQKNGLPALCCRSMKSSDASRNSSSTVSIRFLVSGPVSSIVCLPTRPKRGSSVGSSLSLALHLSTPRGPNFALELGVLRVVGVLRLLLGVEVVEVAEELVEPVDRRQELVAVAEVVLAELAGGVALRLEQVGERRVLLGQPFLRARQADLQQAGAEARLAGDERRAPRRAGLLGVVVGEDRAFLRDAVDVGRAVAHHAAVVGADVPVADVVAEDDQDVRLLRLRVVRPRQDLRPSRLARPRRRIHRVPQVASVDHGWCHWRMDLSGDGLSATITDIRLGLLLDAPPAPSRSCR